jgi:hypothetical protein
MIDFFKNYKDALVSVSWIIAALGWLVSNYQTNKREKRKEIRVEVDAICKNLADLLDRCRDYYSNDSSDPLDDVRSSKIAFEVHRIIFRVEKLNSRIKTCENRPFQSAQAACYDFMNAVTGDLFQSKMRPPILFNSIEFLNIEACTHELMNQLELAFSDHYK